MEKVAFVEFVLVACLGLLLFGSKLGFLEERLMRLFRHQKHEQRDEHLDVEDAHTHHR